MEDNVNRELELLLEQEKIKGATLKACEFLRAEYGTSAVDFWALRDFYNQRIVLSDENAKSAFDKNVERLMKLRDEKALGWIGKPRYESPYFKGDFLEDLDDMYERFKEGRRGGSVQKFLRSIEDFVL